MVQPRALRGDDDLGPVTDRTGRVEGRAVTTSTRGVRGRHSTSDIPPTSAPIGPATPIPFRTHPPTTSHHSYTPVPYDPYGYSQPPQTSYDLYAHASSLPIRMPGLDPTQYFSKTQILLNEISRPGLLRPSWWTHLTAVLTIEPLIVAIPHLMLGWTGPTDGGPQDPVFVPSYSGHVASSIWRGQMRDRGILKSRSRYMSVTDLDIPVFSYVCTSGETGSKVVQTIHPEVCDVGSQNGAQIN
ncbi:hypothetical protein M9H77_07376 [Catharanthus roseus]|uniref:Uncharacterized protein n=1 Tax=Catharanthus roseus TaxID=4058 RepID=A0ACC0BUT5_CATRO|nr:hypothetical protein M9H77_07376 [Catharanthus roseus]